MKKQTTKTPAKYTQKEKTTSNIQETIKPRTPIKEQTNAKTTEPLPP
jgi:hypothetical protein